MEERNNPTRAQMIALRDEAYQHAKECGFHDETLSLEHFLCLVISELMEAVEADRKGRHCTHDLNYIYDVEDDAAFNTIFSTQVKDTVEDELADAAIRLLDILGLYECDGLTFQIAEKYGTMNGTFTEIAFRIIAIITDLVQLNEIKEVTLAGMRVPVTNVAVECIGTVLNCLMIWADRLDFDLIKHIELKMRYNRNRPHLHGKRY